MGCVHTCVGVEPWLPKDSAGFETNKHLLRTAGQTRTCLLRRGLLFDIMHYLTSYIQSSMLCLYICRENEHQNPKNLPCIHGTCLSGFQEPSEDSLINYNRQ